MNRDMDHHGLLLERRRGRSHGLWHRANVIRRGCECCLSRRRHMDNPLQRTHRCRSRSCHGETWRGCVLEGDLWCVICEEVWGVVLRDACCKMFLRRGKIVDRQRNAFDVIDCARLTHGEVHEGYHSMLVTIARNTKVRDTHPWDQHSPRNVGMLLHQ